jgi:hypothetical protein
MTRVEHRTRARQWHAADKSGGGRRLSGLTYVPLADAIAAAAFEKVNMDMVLMRAIRARPQRGRELGTNALPQAFTKVLGHVQVREFHPTHDGLRDMATEIAVIHRRVERLEELGASNAGFAKEIDHLLTRVAEIEKHLGIDKKIAA